MKRKKTIKLAVIVCGGTVSYVFGTDPSVKVELLDFDQIYAELGPIREKPPHVLKAEDRLQTIAGTYHDLPIAHFWGAKPKSLEDKILDLFINTGPNAG